MRNWMDVPLVRRRELAQEMVDSLVKERFRDGGERISTPFEIWCDARFGLYGEDKGRSLSEEDAVFLTFLAEIYREAWDTADFIIKDALLNGLPLGKNLALFVMRRMDGDMSPPLKRSKQGNSRSRNLYRNYFIVETLQKLEFLGFKKKPSREIIARAFANNGQHMVTESTVDHVQRQRPKLEAEFAGFDRAEKLYAANTKV